MLIHQVIFKELALNFIVIISFLNIILFIQRLLRLTRLVLIKGADINDLFWIFLFLQPTLLLVTIPMGLIIAIFLVFGRMLTDNEMIVIRAGGMSFGAISKPFIFFAFLLCALSFFFSLYLVPRGLQAFNKTLYRVIAGKAAVVFEEGTFSTTFKDTVIFINKKIDDNHFKGVFINRKQKEDKSMTIIATEAVFESNPEEGKIMLTLNDGIIHTLGKKYSSTEMSFKKYTLALTLGLEKDEKQSLEEIHFSELWEKRANRAYLIELNRRFSFPLTCLIFAFLAPPLALKTGKTGKLGGIAVSLIIVGAYYFLYMFGGSLSESDKFPLVISSWGPNIIFSVIALWLFLKTH
jgi:lipopolysaccharide export system permease protein